MNSAQIKALKAASDAGVAVILWGDPGIGKSSLVEEVARQKNVGCETVIGSIREPSDFNGLPVVGDDGTVSMAPPAWARRLADAGEGICFLDEISCASPSTQAAMLRVVLDRTVGDLRLPDTVAVIAAANPPESAADGFDLAPPMANRFMHLDTHAEADVFVRGLVAGWDTTIPEAGSAVVFNESVLAASKALVASFIRVKPALLHVMPSDETSAGRAWPSPRTWDMAARVLARLGGDVDAERIALIGLVGEGAATEFLAWKQTADLPAPEALLDDPTIMDWSSRPDRVYAALVAVTDVVAANTTEARWMKAWKVVAAAAEGSAADAAGAAALNLTTVMPAGTAFPESARALLPLVRRAGLVGGPTDAPVTTGNAVPVAPTTTARRRPTRRAA